MQQKLPWFGESCFCKRPIVVVEDRAFHVSQLLEQIQSKAENLLSSTTIVCLEKSGTDTDQAVKCWLNQYPEIQVASAANLKNNPEYRHFNLPSSVWEQSSGYCQTIAELLRPAGILLQDIQLSTLSFIPADRWWDSTFLATTIRGMFLDGQPRCLFVSNKRGFTATFGAELLAAGHDPRDVLDKELLQEHVIASLEQLGNELFPLSLFWNQYSTTDTQDSFGSVPIGDQPCHREIAELQFDLILWTSSHSDDRLAGKALKKPVKLANGSSERETWLDLVRQRLKGEKGIEVVELGNRIIGTDSSKAESTNSAARHIHTLRKRLISSDMITTSDSRYSFQKHLTVGLVEQNR